MEIAIVNESEGIVRYISSNQLYNLPLFETYMVIDCRESSLYQECHIASALNYPPPISKEQQLKNLEDFANYASFAYINELWNPIILYDGNHSSDQSSNNNNNNHLTEFSNLLVKYISKSSSNTEGSSSDQKHQQKSHLFTRISEKTRNIWILQNGFEEFQNNYPFLCVPVVPSDPIGGMNMIPLPYHIPIGNGIFLGTRAIRWTLELLTQFKIHSVLLDLESFHQYSSPLTELSLETMISSIPDHISNQRTPSKWPITQLYQFLDSSTQYIQDCILQSKRLLVQLYGRSHGCMILIAWLMRYQSLSYDRSYQELMSYISPTKSLNHLTDGFLLRKELEQWQPGGQNLLENINERNSSVPISTIIPKTDNSS